MPQLVKKRRSGWAVLAAGAMVASILAVGATPAAALERQADQQAVWKACLGDATTGTDFTDVSDSSVHATNISCLAYYGITMGKTDDTFDPDGNVTRSQMALFLARAAKAAGIDLGDATNMGFTDIGDADDERRDAINRVVASGIMFGDASFDPPSATIFAPTDFVTRWEMAMFMFAFLDLALDTVHVDVLPATVDGDGTGIELNVDEDTETGHSVDDYFRDADRDTPAHVAERISAIYELGVTTGTNGKVGEEGTFEPNGNVRREQMASFIMRAMAHTNLRPAGVSAQQTDNETQVSVRNADFEPIPDAHVEVFETNDPDDAFDDDGECVGRYTTGLDDRDDRECQIESGDLQTDGDGNASYGVGQADANATKIDCATTDAAGEAIVGEYTLMTGSGDSDYISWAWTGDIRDEVDEDTTLAVVEDANLPSRRTQATKAIVTGGNPDILKMGETLTYTVQLADAGGNPVGPTPGAFHGILVTTIKTAGGIETFRNTNVPDEPTARGTGVIVIPITNPDKNPFGPDHRLDPDVTVTVTITVADGNNLPLVNMIMGTATETDHDGNANTPEQVTSIAAMPEVFSDDVPTAFSIMASPSSTYALLGPANGHTVSMTVFDQYGDLYKNSDYMLRITPGSTAGGTNTDDDTETGHLYNSGRRSLSYDYGGIGPTQETIAISGSADFVNDVNGVTTDPVEINWANIGFNGDSVVAGRTVLHIDSPDGVFLVNIPTGGVDPYPIAYFYGDDDKFVVEGVVLTYDQFQEVAGLSLEADATLSWEGFNYNRRNDNATWRLTGVICPMAAAGD